MLARRLHPGRGAGPGCCRASWGPATHHLLLRTPPHALPGCSSSVHSVVHLATPASIFSPALSEAAATQGKGAAVQTVSLAVHGGPAGNHRSLHHRCSLGYGKVGGSSCPRLLRLGPGFFPPASFETYPLTSLRGLLPGPPPAPLVWQYLLCSPLCRERLWRWPAERPGLVAAALTVKLSRACFSCLLDLLACLVAAIRALAQRSPAGLCLVTSPRTLALLLYPFGIRRFLGVAVNLEKSAVAQHGGPWADSKMGASPHSLVGGEGCSVGVCRVCSQMAQSWEPLLSSHL